MPNPITCNRCGEEHDASLDDDYARVYACPGSVVPGVSDEPPAIVLELGDPHLALDDEMAFDIACALLAECSPDAIRRIADSRGRALTLPAAVAKLVEAKRG